ncbi:unnamed protein product [Blepharisma stoltei]|uniref:Tyrosine-protein kinase ephrin type A/B receptor-like domain-containing protein n=1 Tax=Blepharisma stoltei TaxID=1481888 RepID=A0AAU9JGK6_9CILI|nr:unnamed protein product [Blepharisma stoltei]
MYQLKAMEWILLMVLFIPTLSLDISLLPSTGVPPPSTTLGTMVYDSKNDQLINFGGLSTGGSYSNDLASFSLKLMRWSIILPYLSTVPDERATSAMFYDEDNHQVLLYGGRTRAGPAGDFWSYSLTENSWQQLSKKGDDPGPRAYLAHVEYTRNGVHYYAVFGGLTPTAVDNSLYILDGSDFKWYKKPSTGSPPQPVESSGIAYYDNKLYVWGGLSRFSENLQDTKLYIYDLNLLSWTSLDVPGDDPHGRFQHFLCIVDGYLYINNGEDFTTGSSVFDIWKLNLATLSSWEKVNFKDTDNIATDSGSVTIVGSVVYSFGGTSMTGINNSLTSINLSASSIAYKLISAELSGPEARMMHSMQAIHTSLWVFGGIDSDKEFLSDMWKFELTTNTWTLLNPSGDKPPARARHSSCSSADTYVIFGGENNDGYLSDMYEYTILANIWKVVDFSSSKNPVGRYGACMAQADTYIYLFGGHTMAGYSNELWRLDVLDNAFVLLDDGLSEQVPKLANTKCFIRNIKSNYYFYIATGEGEDGVPSSQIHRYDINNEEWQSVMDKGYGLFSLSGAAGTNIDNYLLIVGGEQWNFEAFDSIFMIDLDDNPTPNEIGNVEEPIYSTEVVYFGNSLYLFGGGDTLSRLVQNFIPKQFLFKITPNSSDGFTWPCSNGTYGKDCDPCPEGHYSDTFGIEECKKCPKGTYNTFKGARTLNECYPCAYGSYASVEGSKYCDNCPAGTFCPAGTAEPLLIKDRVDFVSVQPKLYKQDSTIVDLTFSSAMYFIIAVSIFITILLIVHKPIRSSLPRFDSYSTNHETKENHPIIKRRTALGGLFSLIFLMLACLFILQGAVIYFTDNIIEEKNLEPLVSLENDYDSFPGEIYIIVTFYYYGGSCVNGDSCVSDLFYSYIDIEGDMSHPVCKFEETDCVVSFTCHSCNLGVGASINLSIYEPRSYASYISVNISSTSSIPNELSIIEIDLVTSSTSLIFRGPEASKFTFSMTPSIFFSEISTWKNDQTGYHVSLPHSPSVGSTIPTEEINFEESIRVSITLDVGDVVLVTKRLYSQTLFLLFGTLLGSVFGIIEIGGHLMGKAEGVQDKIIKKWNEYMYIHRIIGTVDKFKRNFDVQSPEEIIISDQMTEAYTFDDSDIKKRNKIIK